jgi:tetratricopeptide (TPR) repeat protein
MKRRNTIKRLFFALTLTAQLAPNAENQAVPDFEALIKAGSYQDAAASLESYCATHPQNWQALYQLGYVHFRLHHIQESLRALCKSLAVNPRFAESHKILGYDLNILGRQELAIRELQQAIRFDAQSTESYYELGRIYYERGSSLDAIANLEKAKSLSPLFVRTYHNLGLAYSAVGNDSKAVENFDTALKLNDRQNKPSSWPLIDYATYLNKVDQFEKARDLLLKAVAIDRSWDQEYDELARAYRGLGEINEAIRALEQAIALRPEKAEYHYVLGRLYAQRNQSAEAKEQLAAYEHWKNASPEGLSSKNK